MENNRTALLTGATSSIGIELAKLFAQNHHDLVIVARHPDELQVITEELMNAYGCKVTIIQKDLYDPRAPFELCEEIKARDFIIDVLVNDAGQGQEGLFIDSDLERELDLIQLNIGALVVLTKHYLREMAVRKEGKILNVAGFPPEVPNPWRAIYHATRAFMLSFTEAIQNETQGSGVTITALLPGVTDTNVFSKSDMHEPLNEASEAQKEKLNPVQVAKDGFEALMAGKLKVVSGTKNNVHITVSNLVDKEMANGQTANQEGEGGIILPTDND